MNDDPRPHELDEREALAASAVVDGIETADDRALVAGSPQLEAWIESYHHIIAELDDVAVPTAARESALSAALAVFDELHAGERPVGAPAAAAAATPSGKVVPLAARRPRWNPRVVLGAAAAVVAVLAIGGVIANRGGDSNDDRISSATAAPTDDASRKTGETASPAADQIAAAAPADTATPAMTIDAIPGAADVGTDAPAMSQEAGTAAGDAPAATEAPADTAAPDTLATFSTITERVPDQEALLAYAQRILAAGGTSAESTPAPAPTPTTACPTDGVQVLGDVLYGPDEIPARVVRDLASGAIRAEALDTCRVLTSVTP